MRFISQTIAFHSDLPEPSQQRKREMRGEVLEEVQAYLAANDDETQLGAEDLIRHVRGAIGDAVTDGLNMKPFSEQPLWRHDALKGMRLLERFSREGQAGEYESDAPLLVFDTITAIVTAGLDNDADLMRNFRTLAIDVLQQEMNHCIERLNSALMLSASAGETITDDIISDAEAMLEQLDAIHELLPSMNMMALPIVQLLVLKERLEA